MICNQDKGKSANNYLKYRLKRILYSIKLSHLLIKFYKKKDDINEKNGDCKLFTSYLKKQQIRGLFGEFDWILLKPYSQSRIVALSLKEW